MKIQKKIKTKVKIIQLQKWNPWIKIKWQVQHKLINKVMSNLTQADLHAVEMFPKGYQEE